jgi:hypothetical protein
MSREDEIRARPYFVPSLSLIMKMWSCLIEHFAFTRLLAAQSAQNLRRGFFPQGNSDINKIKCKRMANLLIKSAE